MPDFNISFLDHVAIRVHDLERSANWYTEVLGLKRYQFPEWGAFPILLLAGQTGIALFPEKTAATPTSSPAHRADHFAFRLTPDEYQKAKMYFNEKGIQFEEQDHHYFHSVYLNDPDGYKVELTTLVSSQSLYDNQIS